MYKELLDLIVFLLCDISSRFVIKDIKHHDARDTISSMVTIVRYFVATQTVDFHKVGHKVGRIFAMLSRKDRRNASEAQRRASESACTSSSV